MCVSIPKGHMNCKNLLLVFLGVLISSAAQATHIRDGFISYERIGAGHQCEIQVHLFSTNIFSVPDSDTVYVDFGDGSDGSAIRVNGPGGNGVVGPNDIKYSRYTVTHNYDQEGDYLVSVTDPNRINGINNINNGHNTDQVPLYIESLIRIADGVGYCPNSINAVDISGFHCGGG